MEVEKMVANGRKMKALRRSAGLILFVSAFAAGASAQPRAYVPYAGRWDLTLTAPEGTYPSWMEVSQKDGVVVVVVVGRGGSLHGSDNVRLDAVPVSVTPSLNQSAVTMGERSVASRLTFTTVEDFGTPGQVVWQFDAAGNNLTGIQKRPDGVEATIQGERAPALKRKAPASWPPSQPLFNGTDLTGWQPVGTSQSNWKVQNGELLNESPGANLRTARTFEDFKLHVEFNCPAGANSGIYLRGRYEVQIEYEPAGKNDMEHSMGSVYGFLAPSTALPAKPGEWESFDITLTGRQITVVRNGITVIDNKTIPGITGGALDSHEATPGPIYLQGDHTGGLRFRNLTIAAK